MTAYEMPCRKLVVAGVSRETCRNIFSSAAIIAVEVSRDHKYALNLVGAKQLPQMTKCCLHVHSKPRSESISIESNGDARTVISGKVYSKIFSYHPHLRDYTL